MTSDGHDLGRGDAGPPEVGEIWAVAMRQRRGRPAQPHRGLVHSSRRSALCTAESIRRISLISGRETFAIAGHPGLSVGDYIDQTFVESTVIAATVQVIPSLPQTDVEVKVGSEGGRGDSRRGNMRERGRGHLVLADLRAGQASHHRHPVGGRDQVQLQASAPVRMRRAVPVAGPSGQVAALDGLPGGAARHRSSTDQPSRVAPRWPLPGQLIDRRGQRRRGGLEPFAVARLLRQVWEQVPQPPVADPPPVMLAARAQQHPRHRRANQLRVGQVPWPPATGPVDADHMIVDLDIQCIRVRNHNRSWMPCSPSRQQGRRTSRNQEILIQEGACR